MISVTTAHRLAAAGVRWSPEPGDRFAIPQPELDGQVFTIADMVVEPRHYPTGTILGFNGTTEWALDSVRQDDALWLPREDQLRALLGGTFRSLARATDGTHQVVIEVPGGVEQSFTADDPAEAYAAALLVLVTAAAV